MKIWAAMFLSALSLQSAFAQSSSVASSVAGRIAASTRTFSLAELEASIGGSVPGAFNGNTITKVLPKAGRFIKWGGAYVIAPTLINAAFQWLYNETKQSSGNGDLDSWWNNTGSALYPSPPPVMYAPGSKEMKLKGVDTCYNNIGGFHHAQAYYSGAEAYGAGSYYDGDQWRLSGYQTRDQGASEAEFFNNRRSGCDTKPPQTLRELESARPGTMSAIPDVVARYIEANPTAIRPYLQPAPNQNQWDDNPYSDRTLDTDGDGVTDAIEFDDPYSGGDPNDPAKKPTAAPYETGRSTVTEKLPNGGTQTTTTVTYSNGKTAKTVTTSTTTATTNPNGTITTTTTTTIETTSPEGETTTKTHTSSNTAPAEPSEDPDGDDDKDGTPNKDDPEYKAKKEKEAEEKAKKEAEEKDKKEKEEKEKKEQEEKEEKEKKEKEEKEKESKCDLAGREWDDVNKTCGAAKKDDAPPNNDCGQFTVKRFLAYPGDVLKDLVVPCDELGDIFKPLSDAAKNKFPFSLTSSLDGIVTVSGSAGTKEATLPNKMGPFALDWSKYNALILTTSILFKGLITWLGVNFIISRMSGQLVIK